MKSHKILILVGLLLISTAFLCSYSQKKVDPVNWRELIPFLIDIPDFEAEDELKSRGNTLPAKKSSV
jgi:hypothetical protein